MVKRRQKKKSFFNLNYTILISFLFLLVIFVPSILYVFEYKNYVEDKKRIVTEVQTNVDERISSVKTLLNYTFFEATFQESLTGAFKEGVEVDNKVIYDRLTAIGILGNTIKTAWYFPLINDSLSADKKVISNDMLMRFIPEVVDEINAEYNNKEYLNGKYFIFTLDTALDEVEAKSIIIGHWVLGASNHNFLEPIGVCVAVINSSALTDNFSLVKENKDVFVGLYTGSGDRIYGHSVEKVQELGEMKVVKMEVTSVYSEIKTVLDFNKFQVLFDFLPYLFSIVGIMILLLALFFVYLKFDEKRKTEVYDSFISTFRRISEGNMSDRIEKYNIEELDLVGEQFNLMMDSVIMLNKALSEEERKALFNEKEKDRYIIKYLSTQINKHFIFNTFGVIRSFVNLGKNEDAAECIDLLCNYLRFTFKGKDFVTVAEEVRALKDYLDIQRIRLPDITVSIKVADEIKDMQIPQFILQPVVENAYKHAFNRTNGSIWVEGKLNGGAVEFTVSDNGAGMEDERLQELSLALKTNEESPKEGGIGLINVQRRLKILMGESAYIGVESSEGMGTVITINCGTAKES